MAGYALGIDLGTTYSAAAVARGSAVQTCTLGTTAAQIASVVVLREDGTILTGEAAERRASREPARTAREFKRRLGDPIPFIVGGTPYGAEALMAHLLRGIVEQVTQREGGAPEVVVLTHPANYTDYKRGLLQEAARLAGLDLDKVQLLTEPEAAAIAYASEERVEPGTVVAVYDLGGGTFDAAVVRRTDVGFEIIGVPEGMERLGGIDIDQAVLAHVDSSLDGMVSAAEGTDAATAAGLARLRDDARRAKEALSADTDTAVLVALPGLQTEVRLTRDELESMVRPRIAETVAALQRTIASAGLELDQVDRILLVGGSSRMPVVAEEVRQVTGRPVTVDAHPKLAIATGAALAGAASIEHEPATGPSSEPAEPTATGSVATAPPTGGSTAARAGAGAVAGGAAVLGASALTGEAAGITSAVGGTAVVGTGPAGTPLTTGPAGTALAGSGPTGTTTAPSPEPSGATLRSGVGRGRLAIGVGAAVGAVAVAGGLALAGGGGSEDPPAATPTSSTVADDTTTTSSGGIATTAGRGLPGAVTVVAGDGTDSGEGRPGPAESTSLGNSARFAVAPDGDIFVTNHENEVLLVSDGEVRVIYEADAPGGEAGLGGVTVGPDGDAYVSMGTGVKRIARDGSSELVVDAHALGLRSAFGPLAFDGAGNLYFFDASGFRVLRWGAGGGLSTVAGTGEQGEIGSPPEGDGGPATAAALTGANSLIVDRDGSLLLAEQGRPVVRRIAGDGTISTVVGGGTTPLKSSGGATYAPDGTAATDLQLAHASGLAIDGDGRLYVSDDANHAIIRLDGGEMELLVADQEGAVSDFGVPANAFRALTVGLLGWAPGGDDLLFSQANWILAIDAAASS